MKKLSKNNISCLYGRFVFPSWREKTKRSLFISFRKKSNLLDKTEKNQELYFFCGHDNMVVRFLKEGRIA